jgi:hypothetical protein
VTCLEVVFILFLAEEAAAKGISLIFIYVTSTHKSIILNDESILQKLLSDASMLGESSNCC